jgi:hypothetical protein
MQGTEGLFSFVGIDEKIAITSHGNSVFEIIVNIARKENVVGIKFRHVTISQ